MSLFEIKKVFKKLDRFYSSGELFKNHIQHKSSFPLEINLKKIRQKDIQDNFETVQKELKELKRYPFDLVYEEFNYKSLGKQKLPVKVLIQDEDKYLKIVDKKKEFENFKNDFKYTISTYPLLWEFFLQKPFSVLDFYGKWQKILKVVNYFLSHDQPHIYIRQICIDSIDTKFIENHKKILDLIISFINGYEPLGTLSDYGFEKRYTLKYPLPLVRLRVFDKFCKVEDITITTEELNNLNLTYKKVFIVENLITFLTFPKIKNSIVIFGGGYGVSRLKEIVWLKEKEIFYWGDIDVDGFAILSALRGYFPQTKSFLMDNYTLQKYQSISVLYKTTKTPPNLLNLAEDEHQVYNFLLDQNGFRLEQEQIPYDYAISKINING